MTYDTSPTFRQMALVFVKLQRLTGFPAIVALAVSACESGWWKAVTGDFNYWGITRPPDHDGDPHSKMCWTTERVPNLSGFRLDEKATAMQMTDGVGKPIPGWWKMRRWFASYPDLETSAHAYISLITDAMRYHPAWMAYQQHHDPEKLLSDICDAGYATGPAKKVELEIMHQSNIKDAVARATAELS